MLIDFTIENYRSVKDPVTLSAVAQSRRVGASNKTVSGRDYIKTDNEIAPSIPISGRGFELLPVLGIFGANASGKSNVLMALDQMLDLMANGDADAHTFPLSILERMRPFQLDEQTAKSPTRLGIRIAVKGVIYTYSLYLTRQTIIDERLESLKPGTKRSSLLFSRNWNYSAGRYLWKNGDELGVYRRLQDSIKINETFLSLLTTRLNVEVLQDFASWTNIRWQGLGHEPYNHLVSVRQWQRMGEEWRKRVTQILQKFDTGLSDVTIVPSPFGKSEQTLIAVHSDGKQPVQWPFEEESAGTQRLFDLANKVLSCLDQGNLILEDELGSNIHPHISREIVRLFQSPDTNPKRAQLIFTSHDNTLQQRNLLRRDQLWFTEKGTDGSTELYPLTDFKPRNDLAIDKAYLDGRFGAVPILPDTENLLTSPETDEERELAA